MARKKKNQESSGEVMSPEEPQMSDIMQETLIALRAKEAAKSGPKLSQAFMSLDDLPQDTNLPLEPFTLQYVFGRKFFKPGTMIEIIGPEHVGKTTLVFSLIGMCMSADEGKIPALYVNTEGRNKLCAPERIERSLAANKQLAKSRMKNILMLEGHAQKETLEMMDMWCRMQRETMTKNGIPETVPMIVALDTLSKMMSRSESAALGYGGSGDAAKKAKGLGESSNLEFSKLLQEWCRARVDFLERYNVFMIIVSHQNTKINMTMMPGARPVSDANNKTKIGGNAINQSAVTQFTLTRVESIMASDKITALSHVIKLNVLKNSCGPDKRNILYELRVENMNDTEDTYEQSLNFNYGLAELFANKKLYGCSMKTKTKFACRGLGFTGGDITRADIAKAFLDNPDLIQEAGMQLNIYGYAPNMVDPAIRNENMEIAAEDLVDDEEIANAVQSRGDIEETVGFDIGDTEEEEPVEDGIADEL